LYIGPRDFDSVARNCNRAFLNYEISRLCLGVIGKQPQLMDGDLALSWGGRKKFLGPNFRMTFFGKSFDFMSKNF